jgi:oligopeptide transport system substrate-binding protein
MKKWNKALAAVLSLTMVAGMMAGCANKNTDQPAATDDGNNTVVSTDNTEVAAAGKEYTYHTYATALADNWNPHTWEMNSDDEMRRYFKTMLVDATVKDSEAGEYQLIFEAATAVDDVTAEHQDDLDKYGCTLPEGKTSADITEGYVYEIKLNPELCWEDGTPINADTFIYSMQQLLNPEMKNYRANNYYDGDYAVAGGRKYFYSKTEGYYVSYADKFETIEDAVAAGDVFIDCWGFWGAEGYVDADGNEVPQYININDEVAYSADGAGDDEFTGKMLFTDYADYLDASNVYVWTENEDLDVSYDVVGFYKVDDYTLRYVGQEATDYNLMVIGHLGDMDLVYEPLYESLKDTTGELVTTSYGTSKETTMSWGAYKLESFQDDKQVVLTRNEKWFGWEEDENGNLVSYTTVDVDGQKVQQYQTTKIVIDVMTDDAAKQAFLKGELDIWTPSSADLTTYSLSDKMYKAPETYTERLFFNCGLDNLKTMDASKGNTNSVVLSNDNFRKAFSLCIDRAEWVGKTAGFLPAYSILNNLYYYDFYNDPTSKYRGTDAAMQAICNVYGVEYGEGKAYATLEEAYESINGYNLTEAKELMATACQELVDAGLYTAGEDIHIRVAWMKGPLDSDAEAQVALLQDYLNAALDGSGFGKLTLEALGNITDRYGDTANGEYAIGYGAWGGAAFYPFTIFQVYCDPDYTQIHEAGCWDPKTETLTLNVKGEDVTMTWQEWSGCMAGTGKFAAEDFQTKLQILAGIEENYIEKYYCIPLASMTTCQMISYKVNNYAEEYNLMYGFGGIRLMTYNYDDAEWAEFVASQNGSLSYE